MKKVTVFLVASGMLLAGSFMFNNHAEARFGMSDHSYYGRYAGDTQLTEEQDKKLTGLFEEQRLATEPVRQKLTEKEAELHLARVSEKMDEAKIVSLSREIGELRGQLSVSRIAFDEKLEKEGLARFGGYRHHDYMINSHPRRGYGMNGMASGGCGAGRFSGHRMGYGHGTGHGDY